MIKTVRFRIGLHRKAVCMKNRILAFFLITILAFTAVPTAQAEDTDTMDEIPEYNEFEYEDITEFGEGAVVERDAQKKPVSVNGYPVHPVRAALNIRAQKEAYQYDIYFSEYPFWSPATKYDGNLAVMSLAMALSANRAMNPETDSEASFDPSLHLEQFLKDAGFTDIRKDDYLKETSMYTISMAMGSRRMEHEGEEPFTLIAIGVCGGGYKNEWQSNMTPGEGPLHEGFLSASNLVVDRLAGYIMRNGITGRIKVWISGFSRAAAVSNVTAGLLVRDGIFPAEDVYAYTFATPAAVCEPPETGYENIFNIINPMDVVPQVMPYDWRFGRFGQDLFLPVTEFSTTGELFTSIREEQSRNTFGIEANYSPALNLRMRLLLSMILNVAENREQYNAGLQPAIVGIMQNKNASNMVTTVRSLLLGVGKRDREGRMNVDALVDYVVRVFGNMLTRTELSGANRNSGSIARRLFNEHCEDTYLANIDLLRTGYFEEDLSFTYALIRGPVEVSLRSDDMPGFIPTLNEKGEVVLNESFMESAKEFPKLQEEFKKMFYMERIGDTSVIAVPHDSDYTVEWKAVKDGTVEIRLVECSVHATESFDGAASEPVRVSTGDTGTPIILLDGKNTASEDMKPAVFSGEDIAKFIGIASVGINWRLSLTVLALFIGVLLTLVAWAIARNGKKRFGVLAWLLIGAFIVSMLETEFAFWFFADRTYIRVIWKVVMGAALLGLYFRFNREKAGFFKTLLPGLIAAIAADIVICGYFVPGAAIFFLGHLLMTVAFLRRSPMSKGKWIQWAVIAAIVSTVVIVGFVRRAGLYAWVAAVYAPVLLLMSFSAGGQSARIRCATKLFLLSDVLLGVFSVVYREPVVHIVYMALFYLSLLLMAVSPLLDKRTKMPECSDKPKTEDKP